MRKAHALISDDSANTIQQIASAFQQSRCLLSACELDIFTIIGNDQKTAKEIAISAGTHEKSTEKLLNALCAIHLLNKTENKYSNTKGTRRYLVKTRPEYIGNMMFLTHQWEKWDHLTEAIRTGKAVSYQDISDKPREWVATYVESSYWRALQKAPDVVKAINLQDINSILDLGCGSGVYSIEFKKAKPSMSVTAYDLPTILYETLKVITRAGMERDIEIVSGDFTRDEIPGKYDAIFISKVLLYYSFWENVALLNKLFNLLNHKGTLIIHDTVINDNKTAPESATIDALHLLVNTESGDVFTESDLWMMLKESWFTHQKTIATPFDTSIIIAQK